MPEIQVWDQFEHDPRAATNAALRASDQDRALIQTVLTDGFAEGRLSRTEYDERLDALLASRTLGELVPLVEDLPVAVSAEIARKPGVRDDLRAEAERKYRSQLREAVWTCLSASLITWVIWVALSWGGGEFHPQFPWPVFVTAGTAAHAARIRWQRDEFLDDEVRRLEKKERKAIEQAEREKPDEA